MAATVDGHHLAGTIQRAGLGSVGYEVAVDGDWQVARVQVVCDGTARLDLRRVAGRWSSADGTALPELDGCHDLDLDFTPAAIAPWLRRLALAPGESAQCEVVHLSLEDLCPVPRSATVRHLSAHDWEVDVAGRCDRVHLGATGLVVEHEAGWTALAVG